MKKEKEIFAKLIKPISLEIRSKADNSSVIGGFAKYVTSWSDKLLKETENKTIISNLKELKSKFRDYQIHNKNKRMGTLSEAIIILNQLGLEINDKKVFNNLADNIRNSKLEFKSNKINDKFNYKSLASFWYNEIKYAKGVGEYRAKKLKKLGIRKVNDLLYYFPRDYNDWGNLSKIKDLQKGSSVTVTGRISNVKEVRPRQGLKIIKVTLNDGTGVLNGVWFNQSYLLKNFKKGDKYLFSGEVKYSYGNWEINNPHYEKIEGELEQGLILPVYPATKGLSQKVLRKIIKELLANYGNEITEFLPKPLINKYNFPILSEALRMIHLPENRNEIKRARQRFAYEELFVLQLGLALRKKEAKVERLGIQHQSEEVLINSFLNDLVFELTTAQKRVWSEIKKDMRSNNVMNRLLQGDVGAGKTVIATLALLKTVEACYQGALMAPTEILAEQHYFKLKKELEKFDIELALLVGSLTKKEKESYLAKIENGEIDLVIGTHALIQEKIKFSKLGLIVIDEQHRFGVKQRAKLQQKGDNPDVLVMTATPIPRTLALTVYGDLDVSVIDELPPGRKPIVTEWRRPASKGKIYQFVSKELKAGRQVYVVCPLIEESEKLDLQAATELYDHLQEEVFNSFHVGLLHGKIKTDEKEAVMDNFRLGKIDVLVSTTVIEVGVDVANASVMIIEDAQRFGLAQLHQLRGRVGRGEYQSYCILIANPSTTKGKERMKIMSNSNDGFVIAEEDLYLRGPGEFFGTRQHGMPDLKVADILKDQKILKQARVDAFELIETDAKLNKYEALKEFLVEFFNCNLELIDIS